MGVDVDADGFLDVLHISGPGGEPDVLMYDLAHLPRELLGRLPNLEYQKNTPTPDLSRLFGPLCRPGKRIDYVEFPDYTNPDEPVPVDPTHHLSFEPGECVEAIPLRGTLHATIIPWSGQEQCYQNATIEVRFLTRDFWNQVGRHRFQYVGDLSRYFQLRARLEGQGREVAGHVLDPWQFIPDATKDYNLPPPSHGGTWNERGLGSPEIRWTSPKGGSIDLPLESTDRGGQIHRHIFRIPFSASEGEGIVFGDRVETL
ncbi:MAG: hypothetical protein HYY44_05345 [Deltaproteobacteria bacterium]|nr:hypothetical protein [Deltaproteobacteria bacterium]